MKNLWKETEQILTENGKTWEDVEWTGNKDFVIPKDKFRTLSNTIYYDQENGTAEVAIDLMIIGDNWGLKRKVEQDGVEGWEFIIMPVKPKVIRDDITALTIREFLDEDGYRLSNGFSNLSDLNPKE